MFFEVGGFPEIRASEDSLLGMAISEKTNMIFIPQAIVYHIFRENEHHFLANQEMLGKYIFIFRKKQHTGFILKEYFHTCCSLYF
ncbi:MAG: hypothetical protein HC906_12450 [Bacteroidales bacterium]|nr:hypothetical protein [Bacteroidales bacterium]